MTGHLVISGDAPREEWLAARRQGITASEIAAVMGLSSWESPYSLFYRKTGDLPEQDDSEAKRLGRYLEDYVCQRFAERHPEFDVTGTGRELYAHPDRSWQLATPDRLVSEPYRSFRYPGSLAVLEAKTSASYEGWGEEGSDEIPVAYRCQVLWQCDVLGVATAYIPALFLHSRQLRVYELTMDGDAEHDLKLMRDTAQCFLDDIRDRKPPDVDWRPQTGAALRRVHPLLDPDVTMTIPASLARWYRAAVRDLKDAERRRALYENRIRDILGTGRYANSPDGLPVARRDVYDVPAKTIERKAFTVDKLTPVKPKEAKP